MNKKLTGMETVFKALADSTRLRILGVLMTGEVCVCHIHESLRISQPKASRHLAYLRKAGLVQTRRDGLWVHYRMAVVADAVLSTVQRTVTHALRHMDVIRKDVERLQKLTGCYLPPDDEKSAYACCDGERGIAHAVAKKENDVAGGAAHDGLADGVRAVPFLREDSAEGLSDRLASQKGQAERLSRRGHGC